MNRELVAAAFETHRRALRGFATGLVLRDDVAEELVQQAAVRALEQPELPAGSEAVRAWLFRVVNNLALDHLRRHGTWREGVLDDTRTRALGNAEFLAQSKAMAGTPELKSIARDHLAVCFACTLRNLSSNEASALLLKEVHGFTVDETAQVMGASFAQVKNWVQSARAALERKYAQSCALVAKTGACFQCVELDRFFAANQGDPLEHTARDLDARLEVLRARRESALGPWHAQMMKLVDEVLES